MSNMKTALSLTLSLVVTMIAAAAPRAVAQDGSIEFVARATPSGGLEEPVRGFPFYLLRKSFEDIHSEVDASFPKPDMDAFIDPLEVSKELKDWMKRNHSVMLSGGDFIHKLHRADVMGVPEFYKAYMERNSGDQSVDFPRPRFKASDKVKDPAKYERLSNEYTETIGRYTDQNPQSIDGIDLSLEQIDPSPKWADLEAKRNPEIHRRSLELAQSRYLVARTETNLQGQGFLRGIPPGNYWLSTLDVAASVGDARPRWDAEVVVRPGDTTYTALSNVNSLGPSPAKP
jgi:hypothetical protein